MNFSTAQKDKVVRIASHFGVEPVLLRASEEHGEAATAMLRYRRATFCQDGELAEKRVQLADELADSSIMQEQLYVLIPGLATEVARRIDQKLNRTIRRYRIPQDNRLRKPPEED